MMLTNVFQSPFNQYADRNGEQFQLVRIINIPDDKHDEESLPMYVIRFEDGAEIEAWPCEVGR